MQRAKREIGPHRAERYRELQRTEEAERLYKGPHRVAEIRIDIEPHRAAEGRGATEGAGGRKILL